MIEILVIILTMLMFTLTHKTPNMNNNKIAGFDFDNTLVTPKDGRPFPKDGNDWQLLYDCVYDKLEEYHNNGYTIVIVTYTTRKFKHDIIQSFLQNCKVPVFAIISNKTVEKKFDLKEFVNCTEFDSSSFYCGDAGGMEYDWSDMDIKFAERNNLIYYRPNEIFVKTTTTTTSYDAVTTKDIVIMSGLPASGKSTFVKTFLKDYYVIASDDYKSNVNNMKKQMFNILNSEPNAKICIDACNVAEKNRQFWIDLVPANKTYTIVFMDIPKVICLQNNASREKSIKPIAINTQNARLEKPSDSYPCVRIDWRS